VCCGLGQALFELHFSTLTKTTPATNREVYMIINYNSGGTYSIGKDGGINYTRHT
jgi:hypothetical protein